MWETWKILLMETFDKHAPCTLRRIRSRKTPWVTSNLKAQVYKRDYLKKRAVSSKDPKDWQHYKQDKRRLTASLESLAT